MDWQGIEWVVPVYEVLMLLVPIYVFIAFRRRVKHKMLTKARAFLYYAGLVISPVAICTTCFLILVGLEEVAKTSIITEGLARSLLILIRAGLVVWLVSLIFFGVALMSISSSVSPPTQATIADAKKPRG